jgi:hypothetical protein
MDVTRSTTPYDPEDPDHQDPRGSTPVTTVPGAPPSPVDWENHFRRDQHGGGAAGTSNSGPGPSISL